MTTNLPEGEWENKSDPWPDVEEETQKTDVTRKRHRPVVLRPSKVREIVRKSSDKRVASDFVELLDQMIIIAIEKLASIHDGGAKTLSARLLSSCPVRVTSGISIADPTLERRRKRVVRRTKESKDSSALVRKAQPKKKSAAPAAPAKTKSKEIQQGVLFDV